jgi:hypothetical protein
MNKTLHLKAFARFHGFILLTERIKARSPFRIEAGGEFYAVVGIHTLESTMS